jgi:putative phosphoesterase
MKIGILSDTHGNVHNTQRALDILREHGVALIVHCGDITTTEIVELFAGQKVAFVWGNIDRNSALLRSAVERLGSATIGREYTAEIGGVRIAACHGDDPDQLHNLLQSGLYRYLFHGHTHRRHDDRVGSTRVINPGALGGTRHESRSLCVLDLASDEAVFIEIEEE